jgi:hypothetical protein
VSFVRLLFQQTQLLYGRNKWKTDRWETARLFGLGRAEWESKSHSADCRYYALRESVCFPAAGEAHTVVKLSHARLSLDPHTRNVGEI